MGALVLEMEGKVFVPAQIIQRRRSEECRVG